MLSHRDTQFDAQLTAATAARRWVVALSGGVDSTVLLHLIHRWHQSCASAPPLSALHINHGLHSSSAKWSAHCASYCEQWNVPLERIDVAVHDTGGGLEEAARTARYTAIESCLGQGDSVFFGHHLDDQVETLFLRLLRGAGPRGLAAMPASRALGPGRLLRPLLHLPRQALLDYARTQGLSWVEDPSNLDTDYNRNYLRAELMPVLAQRWPAYRETIARSIDHLRAEQALLDEALGEPAQVLSALGDRGVTIASLGTGDSAAIRLRHWLHRLGLRSPDSRRLAEFLRQLQAASADRQPQLSCADYVLQRYRDAVYVLPWSEEPERPEGVDIGVGETLELAGLGCLELEPVAASALQLGPGERLQLAWRQGGEVLPGGRSLKRALQEADIPPWWRDHLPLIYRADQLVAVAGLTAPEVELADVEQPVAVRWRPASNV